MKLFIVMGYDTLANHVSDGSIRLLQILGVPRSMSTAIGRSLNESDMASVFINEPFNRDDQSVDDAANHILVAAAPGMQAQPGPIIVITKNMASYISREAFQELAPLTDAMVWTVREPLVQIGSLLTRIVNDLVVEPGADSISQGDIEPYLAEASAFLEAGPKSYNFSKTGWQRIGEHFQANSKPKRSVVLDGQDFSDKPVAVLQDTCQAIGLTYAPRMVEGWQRSFVNVINRNHEEETARSAWTHKAAASLGVIAVSRPPLQLDSLPPALRVHIKNVALPVYQSMRQAGDNRCYSELK